MAPSRLPSLTYPRFYEAVAQELPALLPRDLREYQSRRMGGVFKVWFGDPGQHYELWFRDGGLEVAFHLEGLPERDEAVARLLRRRLPRLRRELGGDVRLEPFGRGWTHLFEHWPQADRTGDLAPEAAARLSELIRLLEPLLRA